MRKYAPHLIYLAVLARAAGWSQNAPPIPVPVWILLIVFGLLLVTEPMLTPRLHWYPRFYAPLQSVLVIAMLYTAPTLDIISLLFLPLSFQVVQNFQIRVGVAWIGVFSLAMVGLLFRGMELGPGMLMVLLNTGGCLLLGSYAHLIRRTEKSQQENQRMFGELQATYSKLKDSAAQQEQLAASDERHRLVRELHDSLAQTLFSMNLAVQAAQLSIEGGAGPVEEQLNRLQGLSNNAAAEVQVLLGQLPVQSPAARELMPAIRQLVEERCAQDKLNITVLVSGEKTLPEAVAANLFRITQEALNNIARHAGACQVVLRINLEDCPMWLEVEDNGCGFDPSGQEKQHHFGLTGMEERADEMGWELEIDSHPGKGTRIRAREKTA